MIGTKLAHYEITGHLGSGGMGEVYQATDIKLGRSVAIKFLHVALAQNADHMARFEREARILATLNHPNIAAIYGVEEADGRMFLVMELVQGETLSERIKRGAIPIPEAMGIAAQITEALEAAHEKGIVHRDLKPPNIKIMPGGKVKVLDFGLAKLIEKTPSDAILSNLPTLQTTGTNPGIILGTAAYMSPEQAKGTDVDRRTDIFAFGAVLYEMLTGHQAFAGKTLGDVLAAVIRDEADRSRLPPDTPSEIRRLLRRCLQKDRNRRLRDIGDARIEIEESLSNSAEGRQSSTTPTGLQSVTRYVIALPSDHQLKGLARSCVALSPDGANLVYVGGPGSARHLYLRAMDSLEARPISGTDGGYGPFFSPDGQWVGFFVGNKMKKVPVIGGPPRTLCEAPHPMGACWGPNNMILFQPVGHAELWQVSADGGIPQSITASEGLSGHCWPDLLPGGKAVIFAIYTPTRGADFQIMVQLLDTGYRKLLGVDGTSPRYVPTGHLVYTVNGTLVAAPFDLDRLEITGITVPIIEKIAESSFGAASFSFSRSGSLVYVKQASALDHVSESLMVWMDRKGAVEPLPVPPQAYRSPRFSPEGQRVAVVIGEDIWIYDISREALTRLTFEGLNLNPIWTPDGNRITFTSFNAGSANIFSKAANGSGVTEQLMNRKHTCFPCSWSPDGRQLAFTENHPSGSHIWVLPIEDEREADPFLGSPFNEIVPNFSPDGRWLAYASEESDRYQIYVRSFRGPGGLWQVSTNGGGDPRWSGDGQELFYRNGDQLMVAQITTSPTFSAAKPQLLFQANFTGYDVSPDGQRIVAIQAVEPGKPGTHINVVLNWFEELKRLAPTR